MRAHLAGARADTLFLVVDGLILDVATLAGVVVAVVASLEILLIASLEILLVASVELLLLTSIKLVQGLAGEVTDLDIVAGLWVNGCYAESQDG